MKWIAHTVLFMVCLVVLGCASRLEIVIDGQKMTLVAEDYSIKTKDMAATPNRWFNANSIAGLVQAFFSNLAPLLVRPEPTVVPVPTPPVEPVTPTPTPVPVPVPPAPTPTPTPTPGPTPPPTASSVFSVQGNLITLDLNTLPGHMRAAGFNGSDNALWYTMAFIYAYGPGPTMPDDKVGSLVQLNQQRQAIFNWFDSEVLKVIALMKANQTLQLIAITNDGPDRCGFRLGPAVLERTLNDPAISASRVQLGHILPPEEY